MIADETPTLIHIQGIS